MKRVWLAWLLFGIAATIMLAIMAWVSGKALALDEAEKRARQEAAFEESVRLALWRMEAALAPVVVQENSRPYTAYERPSQIAPSPFVKAWFELDSAKTSVRGTVPESISNPASLHASIPKTWISIQQQDGPQPASPVASPQQQTAALRADRGLQVALNTQESAARGQLNTQNAFAVAQQVAPVRPHIAQQPVVEVKTGVMAAVWAGDELILARHVQVGSKAFLQGCSIDLAKTRSTLLASIKDLLPAAGLMAERGAFDPSDGRTLASLPLRLVPGPVPNAWSEDRSPLLFPLRIAWISMTVAIASIGLLLMGAISLSQRRAAFVSAVTHELRTPLTTFRMYTEMLVEGMAPDPAKQSQYHQTLYRESNRLTHLVENVLSYARLERGRYGEKETVTLGDLMDRIGGRLTELAALAEMDLVIKINPDAAACTVTTDTAAIERILFNLTDNACKYARSASDRRIHVDVTTEGRWARITVRDHGPGLNPRNSRRLFQPFRRTAAEAAKSAPGVGIGLPLSRRLARAAGGSLEIIESAEGACLRLELPLNR